MSDIDELNELLWDAEEVGAYAYSSCGGVTGILVVTNRRIFFLSKEFSPMKITKSLFINKIKSIDCGKETFFGWIEIGIKKTRKSLRFDNMDNESVIEIYNYIAG